MPLNPAGSKGTIVQLHNQAPRGILKGGSMAVSLLQPLMTVQHLRYGASIDCRALATNVRNSAQPPSQLESHTTWQTTLVPTTMCSSC